MENEVLDADSHLEWLEKLGLHETAYLISFQYIENDSIGFFYLEQIDALLDEYDDDYECSEWIKSKKQLKTITIRHKHRFRKKNE